MEAHIGEFLWFTFGCIVLFCLHRVVVRVCTAMEIMSSNEAENWAKRFDTEREKRLSTESTERTHIVMGKNKADERAAAQATNSGE